jgi:hypothetical protein
MSDWKAIIRFGQSLSRRQWNNSPTRTDILDQHTETNAVAGEKKELYSWASNTFVHVGPSRIGSPHEDKGKASNRHEARLGEVTFELRN